MIMHDFPNMEDTEVIAFDNGLVDLPLSFTAVDHLSRRNSWKAKYVVQIGSPRSDIIDQYIYELPFDWYLADYLEVLNDEREMEYEYDYLVYFNFSEKIGDDYVKQEMIKFTGRKDLILVKNEPCRFILYINVFSVEERRKRLQSFTSLTEALNYVYKKDKKKEHRIPEEIRKALLEQWKVDGPHVHLQANTKQSKRAVRASSLRKLMSFASNRPSNSKKGPGRLATVGNFFGEIRRKPIELSILEETPRNTTNDSVLPVDDEDKQDEKVHVGKEEKKEEHKEEKKEEHKEEKKEEHNADTSQN